MVFVEIVDNNEYRKGFLEKGIKKIKEFPTLYSILGKFKNFLVSKHNHNIFLNLLASAQHDVFLDGPNKRSEETIRKVEDVLTKFKINEFKRNVRKAIQRKMQSFDRDQNNSVFSELILLHQLMQNKNVRNIEYANMKDSNHDFRFILNDIEFNLELTVLNESKPAQILRKIFTNVARELISLMPERTILKVEIKTDLLLGPNKNFDEISSTKYLLNEFRKFLPLILVQHGSCIMHFLDENYPLYEKKDLFQYYEELGERLNLLTKDKKGSSFLKSTKSDEINKSPVSYFIYGPAKYGLVSISSEVIYPSRAEQLRQMSLLNQLNRALEGKLKKNQLKNQTNPIIAIKFQDTVFNFYTDNDPYSAKAFRILKESIRSTFKESNNSEIIGLLLYEDLIENARFIENPLCKVHKETIKKIRLLTKSTDLDNL